MTIEAAVTEEDLRPGEFVDSDHPAVVAFAARAVAEAGATTERERAVALFLAVRDGIRYDPFDLSRDPADYRASRIAEGHPNWCVPKSVLLAAAARSQGIPARLGFADVQNHLQSPRLLERMKTDLFAWHGYVLLHVDGRWLKVSSAFNRDLCERFGTKVLEFDGTADALLHPFDTDGNRHMEYVQDRGVYHDLPLDEILDTFDVIYADLYEH
jgi:transglutaminase-like putative cysteine protease